MKMKFESNWDLKKEKKLMMILLLSIMPLMMNCSKNTTNKVNNSTEKNKVEVVVKNNSSKPLPQGTIPEYTENIKKYGIKLSGTFSSNKLIFEVNEKITGKVIEKEYYGPPNYGETPELDAKEIESIICFDEPKNFFVDERLAVIKEMQLVFYKSFYKDSDFIPRKRYSFTGRIIPAETGHHHTDYIFLVDDYNLEENQIE